MPNKTPPLETIPGKDLLARPIEPLGFTISEILPHGLFILAGSPKVGKSWLALDLCRAVASGGDFWNYSAERGDALYLALEDNPARLQERLSKVSPECDMDATTDIHFATRVQKLGKGLSEQLTEFLDAQPLTKLIVIDTMQYIRNTGKAVGTYAKDYQDMDALRDIIAGRNLTLLLITHTRKSGDADPLNLISGSTGLVGAVDGVFILEKVKRVGIAAKLTIANRDTEGHQFELRFDKGSCHWQFEREVSDCEDGDDEQLYDLLNFLLDEVPSWVGTATELAAVLLALEPTFAISPIALAKTLKQQAEVLQLEHNIVCTFKRNKSARTIELSRTDGDIIIIPETDYTVIAAADIPPPAA